MSHRGKRTVSRAGYHAYIRSPEWRAVRQRYRDSKLPQACLVCGEAMVELHHRTYKNLGNERLSDLVPLCRLHHQEVHFWAKVRGKRRGSLWGATKLVIDMVNEEPGMENHFRRWGIYDRNQRPGGPVPARTVNAQR